MIKLKEKKNPENITGDIKWLAGGASRYLFGNDGGIFLLLFFSFLFKSFSSFTVSKIVKVPTVRMHPIASGTFERPLSVACWVSRCF